MHLSLYLDDCADHDILAALLRQAGHHVSTPRIAGTSGLSDREHLDYAEQRGYTLLTKDPDDFMELHHQWLVTNRTHSGILLIYEDKDVITLSPLPFPSPTKSTTLISGDELPLVDLHKVSKRHNLPFSSLHRFWLHTLLLVARTTNINTTATRCTTVP